jgi:16S rRNA (guanine527-N7)-methyltransferase
MGRRVATPGVSRETPLRTPPARLRDVAQTSRTRSDALPKQASRRLDDLAKSYGVDARGEASLARLLLLQAVDPTAFTSIRDPVSAVDRHVADSLSALKLPELRAASSIVDVGAGAGWPGFALAAALPRTRVFLVESASRHCRYLQRAAVDAELENVTVVHARVESWPEGIGRHDVVTARALASLSVLCEYAAPLLREGGALVAWKGAVSPAEAADGAAAAAQVGLEPAETHAVVPFAAARDHTLHVFRKTSPTPPRFPRRPGIATKRPLSATS